MLWYKFIPNWVNLACDSLSCKFACKKWQSFRTLNSDYYSCTAIQFFLFPQSKRCSKNCLSFTWSLKGSEITKFYLHQERLLTKVLNNTLLRETQKIGQSGSLKLSRYVSCLRTGEINDVINPLKLQGGKQDKAPRILATYFFRMYSVSCDLNQQTNQLAARNRGIEFANGLESSTNSK
jgi:hypothetical protein